MPVSVTEFRTRRVGLALGLLAASVVTLIGVVRDLDPEVILMRAGLAGLGCGALVRLVLIVLERLARADRES
jgi:hypothetical protein